MSKLQSASAATGFFGLVGAAGAPTIGHLANKHGPRFTIPMALWLSLVIIPFPWLCGQAPRRPDRRGHPDGFGRAKWSRFQPDAHLQHRPERPESAQHGLHVLLLHRRRSRLLPGRMVLVSCGLVGRLWLRNNDHFPRDRRRIHLWAQGGSTMC